MEIKILGTGCKKCEDLYDNVMEALSKAGREADVEKVEDIVTIMSFGVMSTPALAIDGKISEHISMIIVTHEMKFAREVSDRVLAGNHLIKILIKH
jgi:small redox-active disulfide protein 2